MVMRCFFKNKFAGLSRYNPMASPRKDKAAPQCPGHACCYLSGMYKPYIIAAMIFMAQVKDPVKALMELDETKDTRKKF